MPLIERIDIVLALHSIPNAFTKVECELILKTVFEAPTDEARLVGQKKDHGHRNSELVWVDEVAGLEWVMERLIDLVRGANKDHFEFDLQEFAESPQVANYKASVGGHFSWHSDIGSSPTAARRKLTLVLQLTDGETYEGGNLEIMPGANIITADRTQGHVAVFPSFALHQVTSVTSGTRYSMTVWAHGPPFR